MFLKHPHQKYPCHILVISLLKCLQFRPSSLDGAVRVVRAAGGRSLLLSGDGLFQKWRHRPVCSRHMAPVCGHGRCHTLLRHLEVPLRPATQSGPDLQMTALTNELTRSSSCVWTPLRGPSCKRCLRSEAASFGEKMSEHYPKKRWWNNVAFRGSSITATLWQIHILIWLG